ncbi:MULTISPECIES: hypothetical protein [unclassified Streptomyces]|uniref:hypothetical protein n=1 Tax=unclassified Streptomyces TaxID=2593676 RepID=UPI002ED228FF|nr:hypothetical protein OH827_06175 [Streptomyces sp. NBC_00891]WSY04633.1 hypothetical protein OG464_06175 [Streptomyces sp. NBC_00890]WSZ06258.1 hypothetical protein OG704_06175 [Streptomyces sp. NBC_00869]WSZ26246.1 hypothetical protein OG498_27390 [Streptomyces sp. NBC_00870]
MSEKINEEIDGAPDGETPVTDAEAPSEGTPVTDAEAPAAPAPAEPEEPRPSFVRRLLRSRTARAATVAALAGALVGAGTVAWRTDTLPLLGPSPCWDSLGSGSMDALFGDRETVVDEQSLRTDPMGGGGAYGQCRITSYDGDRARRQVTVDVRRLDGLRGTDAQDWPSEFLASGMVPLGEGLPGMTSSTRAWIALPQACTGRDEFTGPTVVDIGMGRAGFEVSREYTLRDRNALTGALIEAANGVIEEFGCSGRYREPRDLPAPVEWDETDPSAFCGIKGLTLPAAYREELDETRVGGEGGPARVCEAGASFREASVRLTTVEDPALAAIYSWDSLRSGAPVTGDGGFGKAGGNRAVYRASCQTGPVIFVLEQLRPAGKGDRFTFTRDLLPAYAEAEAERIGCAPQKLTFTSS